MMSDLQRKTVQAIAPLFETSKVVVRDQNTRLDYHFNLKHLLRKTDETRSSTLTDIAGAYLPKPATQQQLRAIVERAVARIGK